MQCNKGEREHINNVTKERENTSAVYLSYQHLDWLTNSMQKKKALIVLIIKTLGKSEIDSDKITTHVRTYVVMYTVFSPALLSRAGHPP